MTENKRYVVRGSDDFFLHIEDTTFTEDKHEGAIYNIYQVVRRLNEQEDEIQQLKWSNKVLRANRKDCELGRREERKRWLKMDKMRIEHIQLLQKRLKENGLSIYVYGDDAND